MNLHPDIPSVLQDTESEEARHIRYERQINIESMISEKDPRFTGNATLEDRCREIRDYLFGDLEKMKDDEVIGVRKKETYTTFHSSLGLRRAKFSYPKASHVEFVSYPAYTGIVDEIYSAVKSEGALEDDSVERLAAIVHGLGGIIHPFIDGNGQTFRLAALSYLSDLQPDKYAKASLPMRLQKNYRDNTAIKPGVESRIVKRAVPEIEHPRVQILMEMQRLYRPTIRVGDDVETKQDKDEHDDSPAEDNSYEEEMKAWAEGTIVNLKEIVDKIDDPVMRLSIDEMKSDESYVKLLQFENELEGQLSEIGINGYIWEILIRNREVKKAPAIESSELPELYIEYLVNTERGKKWLEHYVKTGEALDQDEIPEGLKWIEQIALESFESVKEQLLSMIIFAE